MSPMPTVRQTWFPFLTVLVAATVWAESQSLEVWLGNRKREVESSRVGATSYYKVRDLARVFNLNLQEGRGRLQVAGSRGRLELVSGRPLVAMGDQYVLLSAEVRLQGREWWVPGDFLDKALSGLIDQKLERVGPNSIRLRDLRENRVRMQVYSYADHLTLVFDMSQPAAPAVREFRDYIDVSFGEFLTEPDLIAVPGRRELIPEVRFLPEEGLGTFRISKGPAFDRLRDYRLQDPPRLVLEIFTRPGTPEPAAAILDQPPVPSLSPAAPDQPTPVPVRPAPPTPGIVPRLTGGIVIDPGHGGDDRGVVVRDMVEKNVALDLSRRIERLLAAQGKVVHLTRNRDTDFGLEQRSAVANFFEAGAFVGLHLGASRSQGLRGPVVYFHTPSSGRTAPGPWEAESGPMPWSSAQSRYLERSRRLAGLLQDALNRLFGAENQPLSVPLAVLAPVAAPAVVIEAGFLTNPEDYALLSDPGFLDQLATAVVQALVQSEAN